MSAPLRWAVFALVLLAICGAVGFASYRLAGGGGSGDAAAERREAEARLSAWLKGKPVLYRMELGSQGDPAGLPDCSQVVGLGLLALSNQLHLPAQEIAIVGVAADRRFVVVPPSEARNLCGHRWDWIEAVGRSG